MGVCDDLSPDSSIDILELQICPAMMKIVSAEMYPSCDQ